MFLGAALLLLISEILLAEIISAEWLGGDEILRDYRAKFPKRKVESVVDGDFRSFWIIGLIQGSDLYHIAKTHIDEPLNPIQSTNWYGSKGDVESLFFYPLMSSFDEYEPWLCEHTIFSQNNLVRWNLQKNNNCDSNPIPHIYRTPNSLGGGYLFRGNLVGKESYVELSGFCQKRDLTVHPIEELYKQYPAAKAQMEACAKKNEVSCAADADYPDYLVEVPRDRVSFHRFGLSLHAHCMGRKDGKQRCGYMLYDHISDTDFYVPDSIMYAKKNESMRRVLIIFPVLYLNDTFVQRRRNFL